MSIGHPFLFASIKKIVVIFTLVVLILLNLILTEVNVAKISALNLV